MMPRSLRLGAMFLLVAATAWLLSAWGELGEVAGLPQVHNLAGLTALYLGSHLLRMMRLALLTLDSRSHAVPAMAAHALTAFPSSFLPYKLGEILRLAAFAHVFGGARRALAVWLVERFSDILVISAFILALYQLDVKVPPAMQLVLILFVAASATGLLALFAVSKIFVYLNRRLVLTSHSRRGLALLRASHALRQIEADIQRSTEGRFSGVILLTLAIWGLEVAAVSLFLASQSAGGAENVALLFVSGLLASLPGARVPGVEGFGLYQSLGLVVLCLLTLLLAWAGSRLGQGGRA